MRTGRANDHDVGSNLGLLESWLEVQRVYRGLPGDAVGIVQARRYSNKRYLSRVHKTPRTYGDCNDN